MAEFEYKVVPAPRKAGRAKGVRGHDEKYAYTLGEIMNKMAADGWQYLRAESLPVDEKAGMMGKTTEKYLSLLVFQRQTNAPAAIAEPVFEEPTVNVPEFLSDPAVQTPVNPEPVADPMELHRSEPEETIEETVPSLGPATRD